MNLEDKQEELRKLFDESYEGEFITVPPFFQPIYLKNFKSYAILREEWVERKLLLDSLEEKKSDIYNKAANAVMFQLYTGNSLEDKDYTDGWKDGYEEAWSNVLDIIKRLI